MAKSDAFEAKVVSGTTILIANHLLEVCGHLCGEQSLEQARAPSPSTELQHPDLSDVRGQHYARRALEVAAAGAHNLLMSRLPGAGKTMLATRLPGILPDLEEREAIETAAVRSVSSLPLEIASWKKRPFRSPHHTASGAALVGGGSRPKPGEISLAHNGVLFLDELPEFDRHVLEVLREPMESGFVTISRAATQVRYPARFQLIAAMNPRPCGWMGDPSGRCHCSPDQVQRYRARVSGPLLDRIDLQIEVAALNPKDLQSQSSDAGESSQTVLARVQRAQDRQYKLNAKLNCKLDMREVDRDCVLKPADRDLLRTASERLGLSARAWNRVLKVARTIADLSAHDNIGTQHLSEAIAYRAT